MVALAVVGDDEVDLFQVDLALEILHKIKAVGRPDRVDQDGLLLLDEIGVLAGAVVDGEIVPVKGLQLPVGPADPADVVFNELAHGGYLLCKKENEVR